MSTTRSDSVLAPPGYGDAVRAWYQAADAAYGAMWQPWTRLWQPAPAGGCSADRPCRCDPCDCCTPDADIVIQARVGERRVVPLVLHNPGRRAKTVTVDVGPFTACGEPTGVTVGGQVLAGQDVELAGCANATVSLVLDIAGAPAAGDPASTAATKDAAGGRKPPAAPPRDLPPQDLPVGQAERCATFVADVRLGGCGSRAVRIGVVVLPAKCGAYQVGCDCGCC